MYKILIVYIVISFINFVLRNFIIWKNINDDIYINYVCKKWNLSPEVAKRGIKRITSQEIFFIFMPILHIASFSFYLLSIFKYNEIFNGREE